jgi:hypothetical protein
LLTSLCTVVSFSTSLSVHAFLNVSRTAANFFYTK